MLQMFAMVSIIVLILRTNSIVVPKIIFNVLLPKNVLTMKKLVMGLKTAKTGLTKEFPIAKNIFL